MHVVYGLAGAQDARQVHPRRAPRGRRRAPLRARRHRQLPPDDRAPLHGLRPVHVPTSDIGDDVADMFNLLTGYARPRGYRQVLVAPDAPARRDHRRDRARRSPRTSAGGTRASAMKMNSLVDRRCIQALYRASQAGVPIDLNVRGICCLRPGVPGVSENIRVVSVVGRFLEHSRIYAFERGERARSSSARPT